MQLSSSQIMTAAGLALRRLRADWRLAAALLAGTVIASALLAGTAIYRDALKALGLRTELTRVEDSALDIRVVSANRALNHVAVEESQAGIGAGLTPLATFLDGGASRLMAETLFLAGLGQPLPGNEDRPRARLQAYDGLAEHSELVAGAWPEPAPRTVPYPVAMGAGAAEQLGVALGDRFDLHRFRGDDDRPIPVQVVGLISPNDYSERYWGSRRDHFLDPRPSYDTFAFFLPAETLIDGVAAAAPDFEGTVELLAFVDRSAFRAEQARDAAAQVRLALDQIELRERTRVESGLPEALERFAAKQFSSSVPLLVMGLQIAAIVLYYLALVSGLLVERQASDAAWLRSRGGVPAQVFGVYIIQGLALAGVGLALGPLLAREGVALLGWTSAFTEITEGGRLPASLSLEAYGWAAAGAVLGLGALLLPAWRAARRTSVQLAARLARPPAQSAFQRAYLDLVVVGAGALLFFQLRDSGSLVTEDLFGNLDYDPLLLLAPAVFLVTITVLFLRLFPALLRLGGAAVQKGKGVALAFGFWHLSRSPLQTGRIAVLLIMAAALAMFGGTFGATLDQSFDEQALYAAGAPLRLTRVEAGGVGAAELERRADEVPGVARSVAAVRSTVTWLGRGAETHLPGLLAVDSARFAAVAWFRNDFSGPSLGGLMDRLAAPPGEDRPRIVLPGNAAAVGVWIWAPQGQRGVEPSIRLVDPAGRYRNLPLLDAGVTNAPEGWRFMTAGLESDSAGAWEVLALYGRATGLGLASGALIWDELQAAPDSRLGPAGFANGALVESFDDPSIWRSISDGRSQVPDDLRAAGAGIEGGALRYAWGGGFRFNSARGVRLAGNDDPLRVLASTDFLAAAELEVGSNTLLRFGRSALQATIVGEFSLFPTWDPNDPSPTASEGFLVADQVQLDHLINRNPTSSGTLAPNEIWLQPDGEGGLRELRAALPSSAFADARVVDAEALRTQEDEDPLAAAGWEGMLFITFIAVLVLSAIGVIVAAAVVARRRALEFAILRTMGFSIRQIVGVVGFEQLFVVAVALGLGVAVGLPLGDLMLDFAGFTDPGEQASPPLRTVTDWRTIGIAYGGLLAVFLLTAATVVAFYARLALHRVLRLGDA